MAKLKMLKYPKKPKQSASAATIENYFRKVKEVDAENRKRKSENAKQESLKKKLAGFRPGHSSVPGGHKRRKSSSKKARVGSAKKSRKRSRR